MSHPPPGSPEHVGAPPGPPAPRRCKGAGSFLPGVAAGLALMVVVTAGSAVVLRSARPVAGPVTSTSTQPAPAASGTPATAGNTARVDPSQTSPSRTSPSGATRGRTSTSAPSPRSGPPGPDRSLKTNDIYRIDLGGRRVSCDLQVRSPRPPLQNSALAPYLREVVDCLVRAFRKPLADRGFTLAAPTVTTFGKKVTTPCGTYGPDRAPAYYCSATQTIYWVQSSDEGEEAYTYARLGYVALVAHEFGHHLQAVTGMLYAYGRDYYGTDREPERHRLTRRLELQAQCFEGVFLHQVARSIRLRPGDRAQLRTWHGYTGDEDPPTARLPDHGSSGAQNRWLERGLDTADLGRCNTWKATADLVE